MLVRKLSQALRNFLLEFLSIINKVSQFIANLIEEAGTRRTIASLHNDGQRFSGLS